MCIFYVVGENCLKSYNRRYILYVQLIKSLQTDANAKLLQTHFILHLHIL